MPPFELTSAKVRLPLTAANEVPCACVAKADPRLSCFAYCRSVQPDEAVQDAPLNVLLLAAPTAKVFAIAGVSDGKLIVVGAVVVPESATHV